MERFSHFFFLIRSFPRRSVPGRFRQTARFYSQEVLYGVNEYTQRTHTCGELRNSHVGSHVRLCGWLEFQRMNRFAVLRDAYGSTQIVIPEDRGDIMKELNETALESSVSIEGLVDLRPESQINEKMATGEIEVNVSDYKVLGKAIKKLPFTIRNYNKATESVRMRYRYLDLRYPEMQAMLRLRSQFIMRMREFLINQRSFVEVETPTLFRRTPGGAQEFVVPTHHPGEFYSLVQSPQQLKQLLMVGGTDRYFQVARCYRDEGARPDRQPEFTQLDIELSFTDSSQVMRLVEELLATSWPSSLPPLSIPFPTMTFEQAFSDYGTDQPDVRYGCKIINAEDCLDEELQTLDIAKGWASPALRVIRIPRAVDHFAGDLKKRVENLKEEFCGSVGGMRLSWLRVPQFSGPWEHEVSRARLPLDAHSLRTKLNLQEDDLIFLAVGPRLTVLQLLGKVRNVVLTELSGSGKWAEGDDYSHQFTPVWLVDFPLFSLDTTGSVVSTHHPFTRPNPDDMHLLHLDPLQVRGLHYDLVINGYEVGGGSERIHDPHLQQWILESVLKMPTEGLSHLLEALATGAPPHAGIALGVDRLVSLMVGKRSIKEVIAFPKSGDGRDHMCHSPAPITAEEMRHYNIAVQPPEQLEEQSVAS